MTVRGFLAQPARVSGGGWGESPLLHVSDTCCRVTTIWNLRTTTYCWLRDVQLELGSAGGLFAGIIHAIATIW